MKSKKGTAVLIFCSFCFELSEKPGFGNMCGMRTCTEPNNSLGTDIWSNLLFHLVLLSTGVFCRWFGLEKEGSTEARKDAAESLSGEKWGRRKGQRGRPTGRP